MSVTNRADGFDPAGLAEIAALTDPPMSTQLADYIMGAPGAPEPVQLARMKVWRLSEAAAWVAAHAARLAAGNVRRPAEPAEAPGAEALEAREWASSGRAGEIRRAAGMPLSALAAELGVGTSTVSRWEHGQDVPSAPHAAAYHRLLTRMAAEVPAAGD